MTTPAAILNSLNPNSQSEWEMSAEGAHTSTVDFLTNNRLVIPRPLIGAIHLVWRLANYD